MVYMPTLHHTGHFLVSRGKMELGDDGRFVQAATTLIQGVNFSFTNSESLGGKWSVHNRLWDILAKNEELESVKPIDT